MNGEPIVLAPSRSRGEGWGGGGPAERKNTPPSCPSSLKGEGKYFIAVLLFFCYTGFASDRPPGYAVASAHPAATAAGIEILQAGGNAFDAAVAISAALAVAEPTGSGLGGGGFWLLHRADGYETFVDGREVAPENADADMYLDASGKAVPERSRDGALAAGIPGEPMALEHLAKKYGKLPLGRSLAPAIRLAREGFAVDGKLARTIVANRARFSPAAAQIFVPKGVPLGEGALLRQSDLARTLERLAEQGHRGFYLGETAEAMLRAVRAAGGIWDETDLRHYRVVERRPLVTYFRDYRVVSAPPPSAGGVGLAQMLQMLEILGWPADSATASRHEAIEAMRRAFHDRAIYLGDPDFVRIPLTQLLSRSYAASLASTIAPDRATPSSALAAAPQTTEGRNTSHFSVIDAEGNRVAGTMSINLSFGSAFMPPGTGVLLNDEMDDFSASVTASNAYGLVGSIPNTIAPRKRPLSTMTPTFVEGPRGVAILGTPGGSRILTMVLLGVLGFSEGLDAQQIVSLPRYHHQYLPDVVEFEPGAFTPTEQDELRAMGYQLAPLKHRYGNMQVVVWRPATDQLEAASDPRAVGYAQVVRTPAAKPLQAPR